MLAQSSSSGSSGSSGHTAAKQSHAQAATYQTHPVVEAIQHAISAHAAQHVLNVVQHHNRVQAATHAAHGASHHIGVHLPANPMHPHISNMLARMAQAEAANSMANPQYPQGTPLVMGPGGVMIPAPQAPQGYPQQVQGPQGYQQPGGQNIPGNNSIANPGQGGDSGIMGLLNSLFGG